MKTSAADLESEEENRARVLPKGESSGCGDSDVPGRKLYNLLDAITGEKRKPHIIDQEKCIKCGECFSVCKFNAVLRK